MPLPSTLVFKPRIVNSLSFTPRFAVSAYHIKDVVSISSAELVGFICFCLCAVIICDDMRSLAIF